MIEITPCVLISFSNLSLIRSLSLNIVLSKRLENNFKYKEFSQKNIYCCSLKCVFHKRKKETEMNMHTFLLHCCFEHILFGLFFTFVF